MKTYPRVNIRGNKVINPSWSGGRIVGPSRIVVHHDAQFRHPTYSSVARYEAQARLHNGWGYGNIGLQYSCRIDNAGQVFLSREFEKILYHAGNWPINQTAIAICLDGFFHTPHNQIGTREQYEALIQTLDWLRGVFGISRSNVTGHRQHSSTVCPGDRMYPFVAAYRSGNPSIPSSAKYAFPDWQPKPEPKPTPPPPVAPKADIGWSKYLETREYECTKQPTKLWDFNNTAWNKFKSVKDFNKGDRVTIYGEAKNNTLNATYLVTEYSFNNKFTNGFNVVDMKLAEPKPIPVPPSPKPKDPVYKQNVNTEDLPALYVADGSVSLYEIGTKKVVKDFNKGHEFTFVARTTDAYGQKWLMTEYSVDRGIWNGVKEDEVRVKTPGDKPDDHVQDPSKGIEERLSTLEKLVQSIVDFLRSIFKGFKE